MMGSDPGVTAEYNGTKTEIGTLDFNVVKVLKGTEVKVKTDKEKLEVGDTAQVVLVNVYDDGSEGSKSGWCNLQCRRRRRNN